MQLIMENRNIRSNVSRIMKKNSLAPVRITTAMKTESKIPKTMKQTSAASYQKTRQSFATKPPISKSSIKKKRDISLRNSERRKDTRKVIKRKDTTINSTKTNITENIRSMTILTKVDITANMVLVMISSKKAMEAIIQVTDIMMAIKKKTKQKNTRIIKVVLIVNIKNIRRKLAIRNSTNLIKMANHWATKQMDS